MGIPATLRRMLQAACLPGICALLALPTAAAARMPRDGGSASGTGGGGLTATVAPRPGRPAVLALGGVLNASGNGITVTVAAAGTLGRPLTIDGSSAAADAGQTIAIEAARPKPTVWRQVATATIGASGAFAARWTPAAGGRVWLRAVLLPRGAATTLSASGSAGISASAGSAGSTGSAGSLGPATAAAGEITTSALTIPIFRDSVATLYGPGFWGHHTACGERLTHATLGVASRTLRCGTRVTILYEGHALTVPVIDRGPFAHGVTWDLTMATGRALGISSTATIGALTTRLTAHG